MSRQPILPAVRRIRACAARRRSAPAEKTDPALTSSPTGASPLATACVSAHALRRVVEAAGGAQLDVAHRLPRVARDAVLVDHARCSGTPTASVRSRAAPCRAPRCAARTVAARSRCCRGRWCSRTAGCVIGVHVSLRRADEAVDRLRVANAVDREQRIRAERRRQRIDRRSPAGSRRSSARRRASP